MIRLLALASSFVASSTLVLAQQPAAPAPAPAKPATAPAAAAPTDDKARGEMEYFEIDSKVLGQSLTVGVYLPPDYDASKERYPVLYFLHGLFGNAHKWEQRETNKTVDELIDQGKMKPAIVVCPDGKDSMYINWLNGKGNWGDFVATELVTTIDKKYRTIADRASRGINGDSMGGYGALNAAFKHPDVFGSVSTHSAAIYPVDPTRLPDQIKQWAQRWAPVYGAPIDVPHWQEWNPLAEAQALPVESLQKLKIYFDCGDQDRYGFEKTNEELHQVLEGRKIAHEWHLRTGNHGARYFEDNVSYSLLFHSAAFEAAAGAAKGAKPAAPASH
jgi:enterochelin esterase-like enzyme